MHARLIRLAVSLLAAGMVAGTAVTGALGPAAAAGALPPSSGYNVWSCVPSAAHPEPVVLLHGLGANSSDDLGQDVAPYLVRLGYCVFGATYGATSFLGPYVGGLGDIGASGHQVAAFVAQVMAATHTSKVDLVGHSEGAFLSLWVPKEDDLAAHVDRVVAIAPPTHGTTFGGLVTIGATLGLLPDAGILLDLGCRACDELITGGSAVTTLDQGFIAQPGVTYSIIASKTDELVTPTSTAFVREAGVHNAYIQDTCPHDPVGHIGEAYDPDVEQMISNALDPATVVPVTCSVGLPF